VKAPAWDRLRASQLAGVQGFRQQTKNWPEQPLEAAIRWLKKQPKKLKVADFGCGDAGLAKGVAQKVVSLDLVAASPEVTACDMSSTPLGDPPI
jgi:ribosomal RNA-processing protein 8